MQNATNSHEMFVQHCTHHAKSNKTQQTKTNKENTENNFLRTSRQKELNVKASVQAVISRQIRFFFSIGDLPTILKIFSVLHAKIIRNFSALLTKKTLKIKLYMVEFSEALAFFQFLFSTKRRDNIEILLRAKRGEKNKILHGAKRGDFLT